MQLQRYVTIRLIVLCGLCVVALWGSMPAAHARTADLIEPVRLTDQGVYLNDAVDLNGTLYFLSDSSAALWKSDGTPAGTKPVYQAAVIPDPPSDPVRLRSLIVFNDGLFFVGFDAEHGYELWKSDGTTAGTVLFNDIVAGPASSGPGGLTDLNGTLLFSISTPTSPRTRQLWRSDGTPAGTTPLVVDGLQPSSYTFVTGNTMFFTDLDQHLWKTDGTAEGTMLVSDAFTEVGGFAVMQNTLYFKAYDRQHGDELWKSDGTPSGTMLVRDIDPGPGSAVFSYVVATEQRVFFIVQIMVDVYELWQSDGTEAGTTKVTDLCIWGLTALNNKVFFGASDAEHGCELWQTDGTPGGTRLFKDVEPGMIESRPYRLTTVNQTLVFSGSQRNYRSWYDIPYSLWMSNGTAEGTVQVGQFLQANRWPFVVVGKHLFFQIQNDLWAVVVPDAPPQKTFLPLTLR